MFTCSRAHQRFNGFGLMAFMRAALTHGLLTQRLGTPAKSE